MVEQIEAHRPFLQLLSSPKVDRKIRQSLLAYGPDSLLLAICSCAYNTLRGSVPLSKDHTIHLSPYKPFLKRIADRTKGADSKRKLLHRSLRTDSGQVGLTLLLKLCLDGSETGRIFVRNPKSVIETVVFETEEGDQEGENDEQHQQQQQHWQWPNQICE